MPAAHRRPSWSTSTVRAGERTARAQLGELEAQAAGRRRRRAGTAWWPTPRGAPARGVRPRRWPGRASGCPRRPGGDRRCGRRATKASSPSGCTSSRSTRSLASPQVGKRLTATSRSRGPGAVEHLDPRPVGVEPCRGRAAPRDRGSGPSRSSARPHRRPNRCPTLRPRRLRARAARAVPGRNAERSMSLRGKYSSDGSPSRSRQRQASDSATTASPHQARARYG